jgi:hypothetical protein
MKQIASGEPDREYSSELDYFRFERMSRLEDWVHVIVGRDAEGMMLGKG